MLEINKILKNIPDKPGIYQFYNKKNDIIYIGKAKNLRKRVNSYFQRTHYENNKLKTLVNQTVNIDYIIVETESDALLLENSLVKKYQPKYNVQLKDDKTFPWICIKNERFPRVFHTRTYAKDGSIFYGPYTSMAIVRTVLNLIRQLFKIRTCNYILSEKNIKAGRFKVCLEYHIGNCKAPCVGLQNIKEYDENVDQIKSILKGNISSVIGYLKSLMKSYAKSLKYEEAQEIKEKIEILERYKSKSTVVNPLIDDLDVFSYLDDRVNAYVNYIKIVNGAIIQSHTVELKKKLDEAKEDLILFAIIDIRQKLYSKSKEVVLPFKPNIDVDGIKFIIPKKGDKLKLLQLSERNLKYYKLEKDKINEIFKEKSPANKILIQLKDNLRLFEIPEYIECFDNSNIQGTNPVASCVVFKGGKPLRSEYRHYNIKSVKGPDDYASIEEVVYRRYLRLINENHPLPHLIVIDGGKGQLSSAYKSLEKLNLLRQIAVIGIAKKLEEIYVPKDSIPIYLNKNSTSLKLLQNIRNEAHRFGIQFHRQKRSATLISSEINNIKGIGNQTVEKLFKIFKNIENIKSASENELEKVVGKSKSKIIINYFNTLNSG